MHIICKNHLETQKREKEKRMKNDKFIIIVEELEKIKEICSKNSSIYKDTYSPK